MITISKAEKEHLNEIAKFQLNMALETEGIALDESTVIGGVGAVLNDPSKGCYYVAVIDDKVVASLLVTYEWSDWRNGQIFWIQSLYVIPERRKTGILRQMYSYLKSEVLMNEDIKGIRLYVDKSNQIAMNAYKALGMDSEHYKMYEWMETP